MDTVLVIFLLLSPLLFMLIQGWHGRYRKGLNRGRLAHIHSTTQHERHRKIQSEPPLRGIKAFPRRLRTLLAGRTKDHTDALPALVIDFKGDSSASGYDGFAKLVDEVLANQGAISEIIVRVTSPGGRVSEYGLMYAHMERIREANIPLTACVDTYAASGGYLMILPAHKIVCAPLAIVGSIGVVSEFLNFHSFLKKHDITPMTLTAGKRKRTLTLTGEITDEGLEHYRGQLGTVHRLFIAAVTKYRPRVNPDTTCNGDHWTAMETVETDLGLVDQISTSQAYLWAVNQERDLVHLKCRAESRFQQKLSGLLTELADHVISRLSRAHLDF